MDVDSARRYLALKLGIISQEPESTEPIEKVLDEVNLDGIVKWIKGNRCKNIITLAGAGISTCKYVLHRYYYIIILSLTIFLVKLGYVYMFCLCISIQHTI